MELWIHQCYNLFKINTKTLEVISIFRKYEKEIEKWVADVTVGESGTLRYVLNQGTAVRIEKGSNQGNSKIN